MRPEFRKDPRAQPSALKAWADIFATGGPHREEREAAALAARETQEFWLPILEELRRQAHLEGVIDSASLFLLESETKRLRRELSNAAPIAATVGKLRLRNHMRVRRHQRLQSSAGLGRHLMFDKERHDHLGRAEGHVVLGERLLRAQCARVAALEQLGSDCTESKKLLAQFEEIQALHIEHRDRLRRDFLLKRTR